jgi:bifunctional non-homologous end joining protein LigD
MSAAGIPPMLARSVREAPTGEGWIYEPKLDGIRVVAYATPSGAGLVTRNGNDKAGQFPEIAESLRRLAQRRGGELVLDGEIVPLRADGTPGRFQELQGRIHLRGAAAARSAASDSPAALYAFDLLAVGGELLVSHPWDDRRSRLEEVLEEEERLRLTEVGAALPRILARARTEGWEGIMAKRVEAPYHPGRRSDVWLKVKLERQQEFVVGGWTEPRASREFLGALLVGYHDGEGRLRYAGSVGGGFDRASLRSVHRLLRPLARKTSPFADPPRTREPAHWVSPRLVVQVRFNEWTSGGKLRQPVFVGVRDDKDPRAVVREPV